MNDISQELIDEYKLHEINYIHNGFVYVKFCKELFGLNNLVVYGRKCARWIPFLVLAVTMLVPTERRHTLCLTTSLAFESFRLSRFPLGSNTVIHLLMGEGANGAVKTP